jgi:hypothetical protein
MRCRTGAVLLGAAIVMAIPGGPFALCAAAQDRTVLPVPIPDFADIPDFCRAAKNGFE